MSSRIMPGRPISKLCHGCRCSTPHTWILPKGRQVIPDVVLPFHIDQPATRQPGGLNLGDEPTTQQPLTAHQSRPRARGRSRTPPPTAASRYFLEPYCRIFRPLAGGFVELGRGGVRKMPNAAGRSSPSHFCHRMEGQVTYRNNILLTLYAPSSPNCRPGAARGGPKKPSGHQVVHRKENTTAEV